MRTSILLTISLVALVLVSCSDKATNPLAPYSPEVTNATDNFQFQATGMQNVTFSHDYAWRNTGDTATVNQSVSAGSTGTLTLEILDSLGTQVYTKNLTLNGTFGTTERAVAEPGLWTLRVRFTGVTATVNFRVQKAG